MEIWKMRLHLQENNLVLMYLRLYTDHNLWDVIVNGDLEEEPAPTTGETSAPPDPKTAKHLGGNQIEVWCQLEVHGALISKEDINQKFLKSLPSSWNQIALIMRNKPDIDEIDIDDIYNNLRVYEDELKRTSGSNYTSQNLAFLSSENTGGTNEVSTVSGDFEVSTAGGINQVSSTPCAHDMDGDDFEELDLRWQVAMLTVRIECYNCHRKGHFARECRSGRNQGRRSYGDNGRSNAPTNESSSQALVAQDGLGGYDWSNDFEVEPVNYALMAISSSSSSSSSDSEVQKCSKQCLESFKTLQKNYDTEREKHNKAKLEIRGYEIALESLESRILGHEKNELAWGQTNAEKPKSASESVVSNPKIDRDRVIIEDWNSDDEEEVNEVQTVRLETQTVKTRDDKSGQNSQKQGINFRKVNAYFVCKSTKHLIKDCNFHDKKSQDPKLKNVVNTGQRKGKPVWDNTKRVSHQNFSKNLHLSKTFVPSGVLTRTCLHRPSVSIARPVCTARPSVSTARPVCTARPSVSTARPVCTTRPSVSTARPVYATRPIYP
ncbi:ribonuclease H-like domain-containing protein [Tanacetum coccineum]